MGEITLSRLKHCLRYSFLVNTILLEVLELQGNSSSSESFKSLVERGVYEQNVLGGLFCRVCSFEKRCPPQVTWLFDPCGGASLVVLVVVELFCLVHRILA